METTWWNNYRKISNPFIGGDAKAKQLAVERGINSLSSSSQSCSATSSINTGDIVVKKEIEELNVYDRDTCENPGDGNTCGDPGDGDTCEDPGDGNASEDPDSGDEDWEPVETTQSSESENDITDISLESTPTKEENVVEFKSKTKKTPKTRSKKSECTVCGKVLCNDFRLRLHMSHHEKKPQYKCQHCEKQFYRPDHRKRHEQTHTETMEYQCDVCHKKFRRKDKLGDHKRLVHKIGPGSQGRSIYDQADASVTDNEETFHFTDSEIAAGAAKKDDKDINDAVDDPRCNICNKTYYDTSALYRHQATGHGMCANTKRKHFYCQVDGCGKIMESAATLRTHMSYHEKKREFKCQVCGKEFYRLDHFKRHQRTHDTNAKLYECDICPQTFGRKDKLQAHRRRVHSSLTEEVPYNDLADGDTKHVIPGNEDSDSDNQGSSTDNKNLKIQSGQEKKQFKCQICGKEFHRLHEQKRHEKVHVNSDGRFQCNLCPSHFRYTYHLNIHKNQAHTTSYIEPIFLTKSGEMLCTVNNCNTSFSSYTLLELHLEANHPEKEATIKCSQCEKRFFTKQAMRKHTDQHQRERKEKTYICEHCGIAFSTRTNLNYHKRGTLRCKLLYQNESEATIVCDQCGKKFGNQYNLTMHINRVHLEKEYNFACEHCEKKFTRRSFLQTHLFRIHRIDNGEVKSYKCDVEGCGKVFVRKRVLDDHLSQHKGEPKYTCGECGKQFYFSKRLGEHMTGVHGPREKVNCDICGMECISKFHLTKHRNRFHQNVKTLLGNKTEELHQQFNADEFGH